ncbi:MAG: ferritin-like domain-containing protein [Myxococcales bacterium]|nr:ferritin-like domain-containing protein [Myxococcales bacterium]
MQLKLPITALSTTFLLSLGWGLGCGASTSPESSFECTDTGQPDQGFATCDNGLKHRPQAVACQLALPRAGVECTSGFDPAECTTDSDCTASPNGYCVAGQICYCRYACSTDADCGESQLCECGSGGVSACVSALGCQSDADCPGSVCAIHTTECGGHGYSCVTSEDGCTTNADCKSGEQCLYDGTRRSCGLDTCVEGRPFYVEGHIRTAPLHAGSNWSQDDRCASLADVVVTDDAREAAQHHYLQMAAMEHASVAAFARFTLQLMSLGAPADLLRGSHEALADELRHAKLAFAIAAHLGAPRQPGPLDVTGALEQASPRAILETTLAEGCVGETIAAARMLEASLLVADPALAAELRRVAEDETRHAALAWRSVAWLLDLHPELERSAREYLDRTVTTALGDEARLVRADADAQSPAETLGVLSEARGRAVARAAVQHLVAPAARALFSRRGESARGVLRADTSARA